MKRSNFLLIISFFVFQVSFLAQENKIQPKKTAPSDAVSGYTYDFDKTQNLIVDHLVNPNEFNKEAETFVTDQKFPAYKKGETIDAAYREKIAKWMENNPSLIITTLKHRTDIVRPF